jgi:hypothetical protein
MNANVESEKKHFWRMLDESRQKTLAALQGVDPRLMVYPEGGWRVQDVIAHLTAWEMEVATSLRAHATGKSYAIVGFTDDDSYNDQVFRRTKDAPKEQIYADWDAIRAAFKTAIRSIPSARFDKLILCPWNKKSTIDGIVKDMINHEAEHLQDILMAVKAATG